MFLLFLSFIVRYYDQYSDISMATQTTSTKIKETITKITELQAVKRHFDTMLDELDTAFSKKDTIDNQMIKELEDINNLEKLGVKSIFYKVLGNKGFEIASYICGQDYSLKQTRNILHIDKRYMGSRLREVLDDLSRHFGFFKQKFY